MSLREGKSKPKTEDEAPVVRKVTGPIRRATEPRIVAPRTTAQQSQRRLRMVIIPTTSIFQRIFIVFMPTIVTPFPHIPTHFHSYRVVPSYQAFSARLNGFLNLNFRRTKHIPPTAFHHRQNNNGFGFLLDRHIPIPLHCVIFFFSYFLGSGIV